MCLVLETGTMVLNLEEGEARPVLEAHDDVSDQLQIRSLFEGVRSNNILAMHNCCVWGFST